jgi:hypothetical protein
VLPERVATSPIDGSVFPAELQAALATAPAELCLRGLALDAEDRRHAESKDTFGPPAPSFTLLHLSHQRAALRTDDDSGLEIATVEVALTKLSWGKWGATPFQKTSSEVVLKTTNGKAFVLATFPPDDNADQATAIARSVSDYVGLPHDGRAPAADVSPAPAGKDAFLDRITLSREGEHWVLRDADTSRNRASVRTFARLAVVAGVAFMVCLYFFVRHLRAPERSLDVTLELGALVFVTSLATVAFAAISRHAAAYRASTVPLVGFTDDRVIVSPWLSRDGRIDTRPEGRLGAAIRIAEVSAVNVVPAEEQWAVRLETEHGAIDVVTLASRSEAEAVARVVERCLAAVASPHRKKTALMRAKSKRAQATMDRPFESE